MNVYRITKKKYSNELVSSGLANRWNDKGEDVIYASETRSLACLENIVHRSGLIRSDSYCTMVIYIPDELLFSTINLDDLPDDWNSTELCTRCQQLGSDWFKSKSTALLRVPSAVIPEEYNIVINTKHADFKKIKLITTLPFYFDKRLVVKSPMP